MEILRENLKKKKELLLLQDPSVPVIIYFSPWPHKKGSTASENFSNVGIRAVQEQTKGPRTRVTLGIHVDPQMRLHPTKPGRLLRMERGGTGIFQRWKECSLAHSH